MCLTYGQYVLRNNYLVKSIKSEIKHSVITRCIQFRFRVVPYIICRCYEATVFWRARNAVELAYIKLGQFLKSYQSYFQLGTFRT